MAGFISRLCLLLLRYHVWPLSFVIAGMFIVGAWTEHTLEMVAWMQPTAGWGLRDVIGQHKRVGWWMAVVAGLMVPLKLWMKMAKYLTTVWAGSVASLLGVQPAQVFAWHWPIALAILTITALLVLQKLFLLPNAMWPVGRLKSKQSQPTVHKQA